MDNSVDKKRSRSNEIDMLNGPLFKKILVFALPLAASSLLQELFNSVDVAVVGHFVGSEALAAVGSNAPVIGLLINLFMGISMGACAIISNHIGQRDDRSIRHAINTVELVALLSGIFLLLLGQVAAKPILTWMGTPPNVLDQAVTYLRIYFLGMPFIMAFNFGAAICEAWAIRVVRCIFWSLPGWSIRCSICCSCFASTWEWQVWLWRRESLMR